MSIELKAGDYFRRDMGGERYRAVVEKLIEAGMDRHSGEPVGSRAAQRYFGWSAKTGGLFHGGRAGLLARHLTGRLLAFEDVYPQPLVDPNPVRSALLEAFRQQPAPSRARERVEKHLLEASDKWAQAGAAGECLTASEPASKHWDGTGEPQVGQMVGASFGTVPVRLPVDVDGELVVEAKGRWVKIPALALRASPESERAAGIAALYECLNVNFIDPDKAAQLYDAGVRVVGGDE